MEPLLMDRASLKLPGIRARLRLSALLLLLEMRLTEWERCRQL